MSNAPMEYENGVYVDSRIHLVEDEMFWKNLLPDGSRTEAGITIHVQLASNGERHDFDINRINVAGMKIPVFRCPAPECQKCLCVRGYTLERHFQTQHKARDAAGESPWTHPTTASYPRQGRHVGYVRTKQPAKRSANANASASSSPNVVVAPASAAPGASASAAPSVGTSSAPRAPTDDDFVGTSAELINDLVAAGKRTRTKTRSLGDKVASGKICKRSASDKSAGPLRPRSSLVSSRHVEPRRSSAQGSVEVTEDEYVDSFDNALLDPALFVAAPAATNTTSSSLDDSSPASAMFEFVTRYEGHTNDIVDQLGASDAPLKDITEAGWVEGGVGASFELRDLAFQMPDLGLFSADQIAMSDNERYQVALLSARTWFGYNENALGCNDGRTLCWGSSQMDIARSVVEKAWWMSAHGVSCADPSGWDIQDMEGCWWKVSPGGFVQFLGTNRSWSN